MLTTHQLILTTSSQLIEVCSTNYLEIQKHNCQRFQLQNDCYQLAKLHLKC